MVHSSLESRELPRPTQTTLTLPNAAGTDLRHRAAVQTTTGRRRALTTGRSILAPARTAVTTRVLTRGARPGTRYVVATNPSLVAATAGDTQGTPRSIPIRRLVGSRGPLSTITGARPTGAPSTGLLHPPTAILLSLLVNVQKAPEVVVHAGTGPRLKDRLQSIGVPHGVGLRPGEQVVRQTPKNFDHGDQENAGEKPSRRPTEAPEKRSSQASPSDPSVAEVSDRSESGTARANGKRLAVAAREAVLTTEVAGSAREE